jgi:hypothetical protein
MNCPNCGAQNSEGYKFCFRCGYLLPVPAVTSPTTLINNVPQPGQENQVPNPPYPAPPPAPMPVQPVPYPQSYPMQQPYPGAPMTTQQQYVMPWQTPVNSNSILAGLNIWGPFAGYGDRRHHTGWLMDNRGTVSEELIKKVDEKFKERQIPGVNLWRDWLTARGVIVEKRPYFLLKRGLASVALYICQFGKDLFVSLASYLKPPISTFRAIVAACMMLFSFYTIFIFPVALAAQVPSSTSIFSQGPSMNFGALITMLCVIGPLGALNNLALFLLLLYSGYKWLTIKDFWAGLRVAPNEFNEDDLMAMEKAVEQTVRISLDEIGVDSDDLHVTTSFNKERAF